jgi:protein gp37
VENSKIEWTDHTFSPWTGCTKVSDACQNCYAEAWAKRAGKPELWAGERRRTTADYWKQPLKWNAKANAEGVRRRVFCASLADVFDNQVPSVWLMELWSLIRDTPHLNWLLLTKRPQNMRGRLPATWGDGWPNVWLGTTVENQAEADRRIPHLLAVPAAVRFLSCEPLLGSIKFAAVPGFNRVGLSLRNWWVICGGESGPHKRPMNLDWARSLRDQCAAAGVPFFGKQWDKVKPLPDDLMVRQFPDAP